MKALMYLLLPVLAVIWLTPLLTAALDIGCWVMTNNQCTSLDWQNPNRVGITVLWTMVWFFVVATYIALIE